MGFDPHRCWWYDSLIPVNPAAPTDTDFYGTPGYADGVALTGSYAYVADAADLPVRIIVFPTRVGLVL